MQTKLQIERWMGRRLPRAEERRLVVVTGARQTGKTTLARAVYGRLRYVNLDAIEEREGLRVLRAAGWGRSVGPAVLDEAQKEPGVFDKVKYAYDAGDIDFSVLLGSSRFLLLERVRESLAGRAFVYDLWPLMASELRRAHTDELETPLLDKLLTGSGRIGEVLEGEPSILLGEAEDAARSAVEHLGEWGGMPELLRLDDHVRKDWLRSYQRTFLERDLADLARLGDLMPFRQLQQLVMLRSGGLLSYASLARDAQLSAATVRRYLRYLDLSYQTITLPPYRRNLTSAAVKTPKLYWSDLGILRQATKQWGPLTGPLFETLVVAEVHKWVSTMARDTSLAFYRTRSGLEVDLILSTPTGVVAAEIKSRAAPSPKDRRPLVATAEALGSEWRGGVVVHQGRAIELMDAAHDIWAVPAHRLL